MHTCLCMRCLCLFRQCVVVASGLIAHNTNYHALHTRSRQMDRKAGRHWNTCIRATQAAPTCYRDMNIDHRTVLDCSNSFLHPSCPYWFGPSPPRCAPVVLISNTLSFIPSQERKHVRREERWKKTEREVEGGRTKEKRQKKDIDCDKRDIRHHHHHHHHHHQHWTGKSSRLLAGTYFLTHGHIRPQHCPISFKSFSASFRSAFTLFMPSSTRSSCSGENKGMRAVKWSWLVCV